MANAIMFTDDELRTLIWAVKNQHAKTTMIQLERGKKPSESETIQRLNTISKKAYGELTSRHYD